MKENVWKRDEDRMCMGDIESVKKRDNIEK